MKKPLKTILLLLVLAGLTVALAFVILKQMDKSGGAGKPIAMPIPKTKPVAKPIPIKKIKAPNAQPQVAGDITTGDKPPNAEDIAGMETPPPAQADIKETDIPPSDVSPPPMPVAEQTQEKQPPPMKPVATAMPMPENAHQKEMPVVKSEPPAEQPEPGMPEKSPAYTPAPVSDSSSDLSGNVIYSMQGVNFKEYGGEYEMKILANRPLRKYKYFVLSNPPRIVIDLLGQWNKPPFWEKDVATSKIIKLRLWRYDNKLRIVGDLKSDKTINAEFTPVSDGIIMSLR